MESYIYIAVISAIFYGLGMAIDKLFFTQSPIEYKREAVTILATSIYGIFGFLLLFIVPINLTPKPIQALALGSAGVLFGCGSYLYFYAMQKASASKISQLASLEAVSTPVFAIVFLQETPSTNALLGISLIVIGLFLLIFDRGVAKAVVTAKIAVIPILLAVLIWSTQDVLTKFAAESQTFWTLYFWVRTGSALTLSTLLIESSHRTELITLIKNYRTHNSYYLIIAAVITAFGLFTAIVSIDKGPLSIVAPILATYSLFTFMFALVFTKLTQHNIHGTDETYLIKRSVSIVLFITGIVLISL